MLNNYGQPENQTNLLVQIAEAEEASLETEVSISNLDLTTTNLDIELDDSDVEEVPNEPIEETVSYTDPVGNTFEAPVIDVVDLNRDTKMSVVLFNDSEPGNEDWMDGVDESIEPDTLELTVEDVVVSMQPTPADLEMFEATENSEGVAIVADLDNLVEKQPSLDDDFIFNIEDDEDEDASDFF